MRFYTGECGGESRCCKADGVNIELERVEVAPSVANVASAPLIYSLESG